jgi:gamma-glutamyltranspeptidase
MLKRFRSVTPLVYLWVAAFVAQGCASSPSAVPGAAALANPQLESGHWNGAIATEMDGRYHPIVGTQGMVVADDRQAAEWGAEVLRRGGNAIDAAVATAFAMSVTRPHFASLGGGGFMIYCPAPKSGPSAAKPDCYALDYREEAPGAATRDMYIREGKARTDLSQNGALASGVPGVTAGLFAALERFGTQPRQKLLSRPIELARAGFPFSAHEESTALDRWSDFNDETKKLFGCGPLLAGVPSASSRISRACSRRSPKKARAVFTKAQLPRRSSKVCGRPAAS